MQPLVSAKPVPPSVKYAPSRVVDFLAGKPATFVALNWDQARLGSDRQAGFAMVPTSEGGNAIVSAWAGTDFAADRVEKDLTKADAYDRALVQVFANAVAQNEAGLAALQSNYPMNKTYQPKSGTFDFVLDRPGEEADLRYVGVLGAVPAPIQSILDAARGFRDHFRR